MSNRTLNLTDNVYQYLLDSSIRETNELKALRAETQKQALAVMQISPEQGQFMNLLLKLISAKRGIEIGVFTGYSTLWSAMALPQDGEIIACDISEEFTTIGQKYWHQAGVAHKINLQIQNAIKTLDKLLLNEQQETFDYAFIDADKVSYRAYVEKCLDLVKPSGVILIDNVLWSGKVADKAQQDADTIALKALNSWLKNKTDIEISMLPIGDGLTLIKKKV